MQVSHVVLHPRPRPLSISRRLDTAAEIEPDLSRILERTHGAAGLSGHAAGGILGFADVPVQQLLAGGLELLVSGEK